MSSIPSRVLAVMAAGMFACLSLNVQSQTDLPKLEFEISGKTGLVDQFQDLVRTKYKEIKDYCIEYDKDKEMPTKLYYVCDRKPMAFTLLGSAYIDIVQTLDSHDLGQLDMSTRALIIPNCTNTHCGSPDMFKPCSAMRYGNNYVCWHKQMFPDTKHTCVPN